MKRVVGSLGFLLAAGCASTGEINSSADGVNSVTIRAAEGRKGVENAISRAERYCEERHQTAVFIERDRTLGRLTPSAQSASKTANRVAQTANETAGVLGTPERPTLAPVVGASGYGPAGEPREQVSSVEMKFHCQ